jgi:nitrite reductase (NADH) large subunit
VDVAGREIHTQNRTLPWDELVLLPVPAPLCRRSPATDAPHVFTFRTLKDTRAIQGIAGPAVVLGGGVLGVEAAAALALSGDNVTLVHRGEWLMEQQLDQQAGVLLEEVLAERGIRCELSSGITAITEDSVTLANGRQIPAARVVMATGVIPTAVLRTRAVLPAPEASWLTTRCRLPSHTSAPLASAARLTARRLAWSPLSGAGGYSRRTPGRETPPALSHHDSGMRLKVTGVELFSAGRARHCRRMWSGVRGIR